MKSKSEQVIYSRYYFTADTFKILKIDEQFTNMLGYTMEDIKEHQYTLYDLIPEEDLEDYSAMVKKQTEQTNMAYIWHRMKCKDGSCVFVFCFGEIIKDRESGEDIVACLITDTTSLKNLQKEVLEKNELLKLCVEEKSEKIFDYDVEKDTFTTFEMLGGQLRETRTIEGFRHQQKGRSMLHPEDREKVVGGFKKAQQKKHERFHVEFRELNEEGGYTWQRCYGVGLEDTDGRIYRIVGKTQDISEEKLREQELKQRAEIDSLTGIYNHSAMMKHVCADVALDLEGNCAFLILDLDDFKMVNDAWGHEGGDALLMDTGRMLRSYIQGIGMAGRIGGDVFVLFLRHVAGKSDIERHMANLREKISRLSDKMVLSASIGAAISSRVSVDVDRLYKEADQALYAAKRYGGNKAIVFDREAIDEERRKHRESGVYVEEQDMILNETSERVYVMDIENYEMLFMNTPLYEEIEQVRGEFDWRNRPCYEVLYDRMSPCEFCNIHQLKKHESLYWQRRSHLNQQQYICKDTLINWQGRRAKMEIVYNVTTTADVLQVLEKTLGSVDTLKQCVRVVTDTGTFRYSFRKLLRFVCKYYGAERSSIYEEKEDGELIMHYWENDSSAGVLPRIDDDIRQDIYQSIQKYSNKQGILILDNIAATEHRAPEIIGFLKKAKIWTVYSILLKRGDKRLGCLSVVNPKQHVGDILLISTLAAFLANEIVRNQINEKQEYELTHDPHTGANNFSSYMNKIAAQLEIHSAGLAVVDVNNMKQINNDFGLEYGNRMVSEVAQILQKSFGAENVYRFHSDKFTVLCMDEDRNTFAGQVETARQILAKHEVGACVGYVWDDYEMDFPKMMEHAEDLLRIEKRRFHESRESAPRYRRTEMSAEIQKQIATGFFQVYLQPKICMADGSIYGAEALIRAHHPEKGIVPPAKFIPTLEKTETIDHIDFFVFEEVCKLLAKWQKEEVPLVPISFNFSRLTLLQPNLIARVEAVVEKYQIPKHFLEIEITESIGDLEYDMIASIAYGLRQAGYRLSMDDFGTKYSSISTLSIMKFDILKIDRSMVNTLADNEVSRKIMNHVIAMCQDLGIECIAEGVETQEQAALLQNMDCAIAQGYLYGRPMPIEQFAKLYFASLSKS